MESVPELVFAGKFGWKISEFVELLEHEQKAGLPVRVVSSPSDTDLAFLYGACLFTVYPSFYEGWGLPVGEAAWFGKFCVTSSVTSMPEVCGDLAAYVDPNSVADLARGIGDALSSPESLKSREQRIRASELRTWADVASRFYEVVSSANDAGTALLPAGLGAMSGH
jgi:glycosyltransferase involved in cell wall biosynthesis